MRGTVLVCQPACTNYLAAPIHIADGQRGTRQIGCYGQRLTEREQQGGVFGNGILAEVQCDEGNGCSGEFNESGALAVCESYRYTADLIAEAEKRGLIGLPDLFQIETVFTGGSGEQAVQQGMDLCSGFDEGGDGFRCFNRERGVTVTVIQNGSVCADPECAVVIFGNDFRAVGFPLAILGVGIKVKGSQQ